MLRMLPALFALVLLLIFRAYQPEWEAWIPAYVPVVDSITQFLTFAFGGQTIINLFGWWWRRRKKLQHNQRDTAMLGLQNIYYLLLPGVFAMSILSIWGIDYKSVFTTLSIVAAAIAIISKDYISEIISGIIISFSGEISINDYVKIGTHKGKIIDLTLTKIALLNEDDDIIYLPNNKVYTNEIINYTKRPIRRVSIDFEVSYQPVESIERMEQDLTEAISSYHTHIDAGSYYLRVVDIHKDHLLLKFQYTISHRNRELEREIRKKTVRAVVNYVKNSFQGSVPAEGDHERAIPKTR